MSFCYSDVTVTWFGY